MDKVMSDERAKYIAESLDDEQETRQEQDTEYRDPVKELGWAKIEHVLTLDENLSDGAYRTYALLVYYWQKKHSSWAGVKTMAKIRNVSESTLKAHLKELSDAGLITRQRRMGSSSITYLEDLPKKYTDAAKIVLQERQNKRRKMSEKSDVRESVQCPREEEPIEEEPKKKGAKTALSTDEEKAKAELLKVHNDEAFDKMESASAGLPARELSAAVADPHVEAEELIKTVMNECQQVLPMQVTPKTKKGLSRAAREIAEMRVPTDKLVAFFDRLKEQGGDKLRANPEASWWWIKNSLATWQARGYPGSIDVTARDAQNLAAFLA